MRDMEVGLRNMDQAGKELDEQTELRLGLPGNADDVTPRKKRPFSQTVRFELNLSDPTAITALKEKNLLSCMADHPKPPAKTQVVGWPPVRSFRKNILAVEKSGKDEKDNPAYVKVSMTGAPYLRKVDLNMFKSYEELSDALANMFTSFTIGNCGSQGMKDFMNERKVMDISSGSDYIPTYEDKDGDWMVVGDVPWELFVESCKRMRIMKGNEVIGLGQ